MLSAKMLVDNIAALTSAQGVCPPLGALSGPLRVAMRCSAVHVETRTAADTWETLDGPSTASANRQWLAGGSTPGAKQLVLVGAGLGYALSELADDVRVLALEPHPGVATLFLSRHDWRPWFASGRLRLLTGPDYTHALEVGKFLDGLQDISVVSHPLRHQWEPEAMAQATSIANRVAQNIRANGEARRRLAGPYLLQTLENLDAIAREADLRALEGQFAGVPAVVVGAGPSLDRNVIDLAPLQDRALIITADTAVGPLLAGGVRPHLAVAADASELNAQHLTTPGDTDGIALVAEGSVHPSAFARFAGRTFSYNVSPHEPWPWLHEAGVTRGRLKTWGSVLTSAFDLAVRLKCEPIIFAGADLAYTNMRPYCRGTIYDAKWQEWIDKGCSWELLMEDYFSRKPEVWRADVAGERVRTAPSLLAFRDALVEQVVAAGVSTINATSGGILHGGSITQARLDHVLSALPPQPDLRAAVAARYRSSANSRKDLARIARLKRTARRQLGRVPIDRWLAFALGTVTRNQALDALLGVSRPAH